MSHNFNLFGVGEGGKCSPNSPVMSSYPIGQIRLGPLVPAENFKVDGFADVLSLMGAFAAVSLLEPRLQSQHLFRSFQVRIHFE